MALVLPWLLDLFTGRVATRVYLHFELAREFSLEDTSKPENLSLLTTRIVPPAT